MRTISLSLMAVALLSACSDRAGLNWNDTPCAAHRFDADNFEDHPFDKGPSSALSGEHGDLLVGPTMCAEPAKVTLYEHPRTIGLSKVHFRVDIYINWR